MSNNSFAIKGSDLEINSETVDKLCKKFFKQCDKLNPTIGEIGAAVALIQEKTLKEIGCLAISEPVMDQLKLQLSVESLLGSLCSEEN